MKTISLVSFKGGSGKTTLAIHLAAYLGSLSGPGEVLVIDGDPNNGVIDWTARGNQQYFEVCGPEAVAASVRRKEWVVMDTPARPSVEDVARFARQSDLMLVPTKPAALDVGVLVRMLRKMPMEAVNYRVVLTMVKASRRESAVKLRDDLENNGILVCGDTIREAVGVDKALLVGKVTRDLPARDRLVWRDFMRLGEDVVKLTCEA